MSNGAQTDYDALAQKHGGALVQGETDFDALAKKYGGQAAKPTEPSAPTGNAGTVEHPLVTPRAGETFEETMRRGVEMGRNVTPGQIETATEGAVRDIPTVLAAASAPGIVSSIGEGVTAGLPGLFKLGRGIIGAGIGAPIGQAAGARVGGLFGDDYKELGGTLGAIGGAGVVGGLAASLGRAPYTGKITPTLPGGAEKFIPEWMVPRGSLGSITNPVEVGVGGGSDVFEPAPGKYVTLRGRALAGARQTELPAEMKAAQKFAADFEQGKPGGPFQRVGESPYAEQTKTARSFAEGKPGPFNKISETPNLPPEPTGTALPRPLLPAEAGPPVGTGSEGRPATWTNKFVLEQAKAGNRDAIDQVIERGLPMPENARYVKGSADYPRAVLNPKETTKFTPEGIPIRDLARPQKSTGALLQIPRSPAVRESVPFGGPADTSAAERILDDPLATGAQKQAARHFLGMSP